MRGDKEEQAAVMVFVAPDHKVPQDHPIRRIKADRGPGSEEPLARV